MRNYIRTYTGVNFTFEPFDPEHIKIEDIAHHLSLLCRYNGASAQLYSVAQHSVWCAQQVKPDWLLFPQACGDVKEFKYALHRLLHDAAEAYLGDMTSPLKVHFPEFVKMHDALLELIYQKYCGFNDDERAAIDFEVEFVDHVMAPKYEEPFIWNPVACANISWTPRQAEQAFLDEFTKLGGKI